MPRKHHWRSSWKDINKNPQEPVKVKLYSLQVYWKLTQTLAFFRMATPTHVYRLPLLCSRDLSYKFPHPVVTFRFIYQNFYFCFLFKFPSTVVFFSSFLLLLFSFFVYFYFIFNKKYCILCIFSVWLSFLYFFALSPVTTYSNTFL